MTVNPPQVTGELRDVATVDLIQELKARDHARFAIAMLRAGQPWWRRFQLGPNVWGLSSSWLAVCPWNGDEFWITIPFVSLIVGLKHVELVLGHLRTVNVDVRWRWG